MKKIIILFLCITALMGQRDGSRQMPAIGILQGVVLDSASNEPIEYASISIVRARDEEIITGAVTNQQGHFKVKEIPLGRYRVVVEFIGYEKAVIESINLFPGDRGGGIEQEVKSGSQSLLNDYGTGLLITAVTMQDAQPPIQVKAAFDDVVKAREDEQRYINEANAYANDIVPKARGANQRIIAEAEAYKSQVVSKSEGESYRFTKILEEYLKAPKVTKERLYREALEEVLGTTNKVVVDENSNSLMYLPIDQLINRPRSSNLSSSESNTFDQSEDVNSDGSVLRSRENR